jgi:hypothetical protein
MATLYRIKSPRGIYSYYDATGKQLDPASIPDIHNKAQYTSITEDALKNLQSENSVDNTKPSYVTPDGWILMPNKEGSEYSIFNPGGTFKGNVSDEEIKTGVASGNFKETTDIPDEISKRAEIFTDPDSTKVNTRGTDSGSQVLAGGNEDLGGGTFTSSSGPNANRTAVTLGNGQTVYYDTTGQAYNDAGTKVSNDVITRATASSAPIPELASVASQSGTGSPQNSAELQTLLNNPNLSSDQKKAIEAIYGAVSTNDAQTADRIKAAMKAATEFSDPYFKAQIRLVTDALDRGLQAKDGDLAYAESSKKAALEALRGDTAASKEYLTLEQAQELKGLEQKYETDLEDTRQGLATAGFTSSSRRARSEQILSETNEGLVESSNRKFSYQTGNLDRTLARGENSTAAEIANLRRLASEGKIDLLRSAEEKVGTNTLKGLGYSGLLGSNSTPIGGDIERQKVLDANSFAANFVF